MGLDQYLKYENEKGEEEEIYWRKCNFIQRFFEEKIGELDSCVCYDIEKEWIEELIEKCERVLKNNSLADSLLPTAPGFFWGSLEYDEYYFDDVKDLLKNLNKIKDCENFTYWSWW